MLTELVKQWNEVGKQSMVLALWAGLDVGVLRK